MKSVFSVAALAMLSALLVVSITGCSVLPKPPSQRTFLLSPSIPPLIPPAIVEARLAATGFSDTKLPVILRIALPDASAPLNSASILVMPTPQEYNVYAGVRWRDQTPTLLHDRLLQSFRQQGRWTAVLDEHSRVSSDVLLSSYITAFESRYVQGNPVVMVGLNVQLVDKARRQVLVERHFEIQQPSPDPQLETVVATFSRATDELIHELIIWTLQQTSKK